MEARYRNRVLQLKNELDVFTRREILSFIEAMGVKPIGDAKTILLRALLTIPGVMLHRGSVNVVSRENRIRRLPNGMPQITSDHAYEYAWLIANINEIPLEWFEPFFAFSITLYPGVIYKSFNPIENVPRLIEFRAPTRATLMMLEVSKFLRTQRRLPNGYVPSFPITEIIDDERSFPQAVIKFPSGLVATSPYGIISQWGIPLDRSSVITEQVLNTVFGEFEEVRAREIIGNRSLVFYETSSGYSAFDYVAINASRPDWIGVDPATLSDDVFREILQMPTYIGYGLPPPRPGMLARFTNDTRMSLRLIHEKMEESKRSLFSFEQMIEGEHWEDLFTLVVKLIPYLRKMFVCAYLGYRPYEYSGISYTLMRIGGLGTKANPNPYRLHPCFRKAIINQAKIIIVLFDIEENTFDKERLVDAVLGGYLPDPDPKRYEAYLIWKRFRNDLLERGVTAPQWYGKVSVPNRDGLKIARMITKRNYQEVAKHYRMILPFTNPLRYAVLRALTLDKIATNPKITDRAILSMRGYHRYYASVEGFLNPPDNFVAIDFRRDSPNRRLTGSGIRYDDESRLLITIYRKSASGKMISELEDIPTLLTDPIYRDLRGKVMDLLFEAIDAKYNPTFSPLRTHLYRNLTQEEEDLTDMMYNS